MEVRLNQYMDELYFSSYSSTACKSLQTDSSKCNVDIEKLTSRNIYTGRSAAISATFHHRLVSTQTIITYPQLSQSTTKSVQTLISGPTGTNTFGIVTSELVSSITTSDNSSQKNTHFNHRFLLSEKRFFKL